MAEEQQNNHTESSGYMMLLVGDERKTSDAALGIALRGAGHNLRVHIIQFLKKAGKDRGETISVSFLTGVSLSQHGQISAVETEEEHQGPPIASERLDQALQEVETHIRRRVTNILILDGVLTLIDDGLLDEQRIIDTIGEGAPWLDIVMTGRSAPEKLKDVADSVTVMDETKSPSASENQLHRGIHY